MQERKRKQTKEETPRQIKRRRLETGIPPLCIKSSVAPGHGGMYWLSFSLLGRGCNRALGLLAEGLCCIHGEYP